MNQYFMLITMLGNMELVVDKISKLLIEEQHNYLIAFEKDKNQMPT